MLDRNKVTLHTMFGNYPNTKALKDGAVRSDLVDFDFVEVKVANNMFKKVVRDALYEICPNWRSSLTCRRKLLRRKPYVLIPAVLVSRGQHHTIAYNADRGSLGPSDLAGKKVGVRAYSVTTGAWVRGILANDYGVDAYAASNGSLSKIRMWRSIKTRPSSSAHPRARTSRSRWSPCSMAKLMRLSSATSCRTRSSSISFPIPETVATEMGREASRCSDQSHGGRSGGVITRALVLTWSGMSSRQLHESKLSAGLPDGAGTRSLSLRR